MAIEILEIHHTGVRIDTGAQKLGDTEKFYKDVLGLARDEKRPSFRNEFGAKQVFAGGSHGGNLKIVSGS